jgi:hypothetical protein
MIRKKICFEARDIELIKKEAPELYSTILDKHRDINVDHDWWWEWYIEDYLINLEKTMGLSFDVNKDLTFDMYRGWVEILRLEIIDFPKFMLYLQQNYTAYYIDLFEEVKENILLYYEVSTLDCDLLDTIMEQIRYDVLEYALSRPKRELHYIFSDMNREIFKELYEIYYGSMEDESVYETLYANEYLFDDSGDIVA